MHPPCELMVERFLPSMRALVAARLSREGLSQGRIAGLLGVSQAAVSLYLSARTDPIAALEELGIQPEMSERYSTLIAEDLRRNPAYAVGTLYSIWNDLLGKGILCTAHRDEYPSLVQCDVCIRTFGSRDGRRGVEPIEHVAEAVSLIESSSLFVDVMPQVSVNIAYAPEGASSPSDIVAVPGRIVRVRGRPKSFMRPEFGASTHLANILLTARAKNAALRAAINLRFDSSMDRVVKRLRIKTITIGGSYQSSEGDPTTDALRKRLSGSGEPFDAVIDLGGKGLEPSLYLFAGDAVMCAELAIRVARGYSA